MANTGSDSNKSPAPSSTPVSLKDQLRGLKLPPVTQSSDHGIPVQSSPHSQAPVTRRPSASSRSTPVALQPTAAPDPDLPRRSERVPKPTPRSMNATSASQKRSRVHSEDSEETEAPNPPKRQKRSDAGGQARSQHSYTIGDGESLAKFIEGEDADPKHALGELSRSMFPLQPILLHLRNVYVKIKDKDARVEEHDARLENHEQMFESFGDKFSQSSLAREIETLKKTLVNEMKASKEDRESIQTRLNIVQTEFKQRIEALEQVQNGLANEVKTLKEDRDGLAKELKTSNDDIKRFINRVGALEEQGRTDELQKQQFRADLKVMHEASEKMRKDSEEKSKATLEERAKVSEERFNTVDERCNAAQGEIHTLKREVSNAVDASQSLQDKFDVLSEQVKKILGYNERSDAERRARFEKAPGRTENGTSGNIYRPIIPSKPGGPSPNRRHQGSMA